MASVDDVRNTPEYRVAWDLELWKQLEVARFQKKLKEKEKKADADLAAAVRAKETEALRGHDKKNQELAAKMEKLRREGTELEKRKLRLVEAEKELQRRGAEAEAFQKRVGQEAEERVQRVKEEHAHQLELLGQRIAEANRQTAHANQRLEHQQREYLRLFEEFSQFRSAKLKEASPAMTHVLSHTSFELAQASDRYEKQLRELGREHGLVTERLQADLAKATKAAAQRKELCAQLTAQKEDLTHSLKAARGEVELLKYKIEVLEGKGQRGGPKKDRRASTPPQAPDAEVARLERERSVLLATGAYDADSEVVQRIAEEIRRVKEGVRTGGAAHERP